MHGSVYSTCEVASDLPCLNVESSEHNRAPAVLCARVRCDPIGWMLDRVRLLAVSREWSTAPGHMHGPVIYAPGAVVCPALISPDYR